MVESTSGMVKEAAAQAVGMCPQHHIPPPRWQQLEQVICWAGPVSVCNDLPGSGNRPLSEYPIQKRQLMPDDSPSIPDDTVQTCLLVLGDDATPDWK